MNGELVSGGRENLRVLIDYKGSGFPGGQMQDDLLLFSLRPDASPNPLALAVVNFPPIRGSCCLDRGISCRLYVAAIRPCKSLQKGWRFGICSYNS